MGVAERDDLLAGNAAGNQLGHNVVIDRSPRGAALMPMPQNRICVP